MQTFAAVLGTVLAAVFAGSGVAKFAGVDAIERSARQLAIPHGVHLLAGGLEVVGALGLIASWQWPELRIWAGGGLALLMAGAVVYHVRGRDTVANTAVPVLLGACALLAAALTE